MVFPSKKLGGISQTLYNLFDGYPQDKLYALADKYQLEEIDESSLLCKVIDLKVAVFQNLNKRYISKLNPLINNVNAIFREVFGVKIDKKKTT